MTTDVTLKVDGMTCGHCASRVEKALRAVSGVLDARVDLARGEARVVTGGEVARLAVERAVEAAGYAVARAGATGPFKLFASRPSERGRE